LNLTRSDLKNLTDTSLLCHTEHNSSKVALPHCVGSVTIQQETWRNCSTTSS